MMTVSLSAQGGFNPGVPKALFSGRYYMLVFTRSYDVSADGRRFLAIKDVERAAPTDSKPLIVVLNVLGELQPLARAR